MAARIGIQLNSSFDLSVSVIRKNGLIIQGIVVGETDKQNIENLLVSNKGYWREYPYLGVGALGWVKSVGRSNGLAREINIQLLHDGYTKHKATVSTTGTVTITDK